MYIRLAEQRFAAQAPLPRSLEGHRTEDTRTLKDQPALHGHRVGVLAVADEAKPSVRNSLMEEEGEILSAQGKAAVRTAEVVAPALAELALVSTGLDGP